MMVETTPVAVVWWDRPALIRKMHDGNLWTLLDIIRSDDTYLCKQAGFGRDAIKRIRRDVYHFYVEVLGRDQP